MAVTQREQSNGKAGGAGLFMVEGPQVESSPGSHPITKNVGELLQAEWRPGNSGDEVGFANLFLSFSGSPVTGTVGPSQAIPAGTGAPGVVLPLSFTVNLTPSATPYAATLTVIEGGVILAQHPFTVTVPVQVVVTGPDLFVIGEPQIF